MLSQSLTRLEQNVNARLTLYDTRLKTQEDNQMLIQTELRTLKRLFNDVSDVYGSLQTLLVKLRSGA
jgi:chaperonin cofactor prefoldin